MNERNLHYINSFYFISIHLMKRNRETVHDNQPIKNEAPPVKKQKGLLNINIGLDLLIMSLI